eukprot:scaffold1187_cov258-Pinguiococcus_pyrenoidosus.AAC.9
MSTKDAILSSIPFTRQWREVQAALAELDDLPRIQAEVSAARIVVPAAVRSPVRDPASTGPECPRDSGHAGERVAWGGFGDHDERRRPSSHGRLRLLPDPKKLGGVGRSVELGGKEDRADSSAGAPGPPAAEPRRPPPTPPRSVKTALGRMDEQRGQQALDAPADRERRGRRGTGARARHEQSLQASPRPKCHLRLEPRR